MKRMILRSMSMLLALALIVTLLPFNPVKSNAASIYFQFDDYSTSSAAPTEVNTNIINISGTYVDIASATITYKIEKIAGSEEPPLPTQPAIETVVGTTRPVLTGTNAFMFAGVSIFDGLNRITISGTNKSGNVVSGTAYVNFTNVPAITNVKLADGTVLPDGVPIVTSSPNAALSVTAPNADEVTLNGSQMYGGAGSSFVLSGIALQHGINKLTIIASNASKTYELTRYLVYYNGNSTAYNVNIGTQSIDGNPTITGATGPSGAITGQVIVPVTSTSVVGSTYNFSLSLKKKDGTVVFTDNSVAGTVTATGSGYAIYSFISSANASISANGEYILSISGPGTSDVDSLTFKFQDQNSPYISGVKQAYNVSTSGTSATYTSSATFADNSSLMKLPIWLVLDTVNFNSQTVSVKVMKNGTDITSSSSVTINSSYRNSLGQPVVLISNLPAGEVQLVFQVGTSEEVVRSVTYMPAAAILLSNIHTGQVFNTPEQFAATTISGQLLNFNVTNTAELDTLKVTLNGKTVPLKQNSNIHSDGTFDFNPSFDPASPLTLVAGANNLLFEGTANGVPVSTQITVYLFSPDQPAITAIFPVPYAVNPTLDDPQNIKRYFTDKDVKFAITDSDSKQYTTTEKELDLLFNVKDLETLEVQVNGSKVAGATVDSLKVLSVDAGNKSLLCVENSNNLCTTSGSLNTIDNLYHLRLSDVVLPQSGMTTITVILHKGTATVMQTVMINRDLSPYIILSPKLPNESVINANFLKVSIKAEGADQVLIGKVAMTKGEGDIFRYQMEGLKAGVNTVKFTVVTGSQKVNGSFQVNYAADDSIAAQYRTKLPKSGKISIFNGDLSLQFPKNTFLRQANTNPGQDVKTIDLFDAQYMLFGIADRSDGRTVEQYNQVGEQDANHNYLDGTLKKIPANKDLQARLTPDANFSLASNLFWIDSGYFDTDAAANGDYKLVDAMHPYATGNEFLNRIQDPRKWLEPSQRGTITLKYDPNIADAYGKNLSVWRYVNDGSKLGWVNIGGVVNTGQKTVTAPFDGFGYYAVMGLRYSFNDVIGHPYARTAVESMFAHGIMGNKDQGSFGVYENITRGEFAQMLVKMTGVPLQYDPNNMTFDDVLPYHFDNQYWDYRYVETAVKKGYIRGKQPRLFWPNDPVTREEAAVMISRAFNLVKSNADAAKDLTALQKAFTDANKVDTYSVSAVLAINKAGYISGIPNTVVGKAKPTYRFEPQSFLSRADAAMIAERVMKKMKKL